MPRGRRNPEYIGKPPEAVRAFQSQRSVARRRGIEFLFSFEEWWAWWQTGDRWSNRGMGRDKFVMARKGDTGPYSPENVYCATHKQNSDDIPIETRSDATKRSWVNYPVRNMAKGANHYKARAIRTPEGIFPTATDAAEHYGITRQGIRNRAVTGKAGWGFVQPR